ncbi:MAG: 6-bladed beta-propeller [Candidatus Aminicenantales bacterium]
MPKERCALLCWLSFALIASIAPQKPGDVVNQGPVFGEFKPAYVESVLISDSGEDPNTMFSRVLDLKMDSRGRLFILEPDKISIFDRTGRFLGTLGRQGQGPGEYESARSLFVDTRDFFYINDQGRAVNIYRPDEKFERRISMHAFLEPAFTVDDKGNVFGLTMEISPAGARKVLARIGPDGKTISILNAFQDPATKVVGANGGGVMGGILHRDSLNGFLCPAADGRVCFGHNSEYELQVYGPDGRLLFKFADTERPVSTAEEVRAAEKKYGKEYVKTNLVFPEHKPFFQGLLSDEKGRIYVLRTKPFFPKDKKQVVDIFDKSGHFLCRTVFPYTPSVIRDGALYAIDRDSEGKVSILKIEIRNYATLPERLN